MNEPEYRLTMGWSAVPGESSCAMEAAGKNAAASKSPKPQNAGKIIPEVALRCCTKNSHVQP